MVPAVDHVSYDSVHVCATPLTAHCSVVQEVAVLNEAVREPGCKAAADLLCHSPYAWFQEATPDDPLIRDWVARCQARPAVVRTIASDAAAMRGVAA